MPGIEICRAFFFIHTKKNYFRSNVSEEESRMKNIYLAYFLIIMLSACGGKSSAYSAIQQLQMFLEYFPDSSKKDEAQSMIFALQDKLVMKEYLSAKLYYNLGNYLGNNYESCVITAQNALKDYPYTNMREDLSILILRAKYEMAVYSVEDKRAERYREAVDEYYAFKNEFPESKYMKDADRIFKEAQKILKD